MDVIFSPADIDKGSLILVNQTYPLRCGYNPTTLIAVNLEYPDILLDMKAASVLQHLMDDLKCGSEIVPVSGYRSLTQQKRIYAKALKEHGKEFTRQYVALPNHSEHQTGLAIDLGRKMEEIDFIRPDFPYEGICDRFRKKAPEYGFIERYQKGKEDITGIAFEPWHFRYVGYPHSKIMAHLNISLEEYVDFIREYPYQGKHFQAAYLQNAEVFYLNLSECGGDRIQLPDPALYQISGNNVDGVIVTVWR